VACAYPEILGSLQGELGRLYDAEVSHDVRDFLVTDRQVLASLAPGDPGRATDEQLIVVERDSDLDVALYLDPGVLERLVAADPRERISRSNLADFWTVLEGVSHFHYLAWNANLDKPVTLLEMEVQAEVDKYMSTRLLLAAQPRATLGAPLLQRLFDDPSLDPALDAEEADRYQAASSLARRYCAGLESRFPDAGLTPELLRELRTFYRLPQSAKIGRIRARGFA
jgi:hypothetical protein